MEHYSTIKRNKVLIHSITEMKPKDMLSKRCHSQKTTYCMILFI